MLKTKSGSYTEDQVAVYSFLTERGGDWCAEDVAHDLAIDYWRTYRTLRQLEADGWVLASIAGGDYQFRAVTS